MRSCRIAAIGRDASGEDGKESRKNLWVPWGQGSQIDPDLKELTDSGSQGSGVKGHSGSLMKSEMNEDRWKVNRDSFRFFAGCYRSCGIFFRIHSGGGGGGWNDRKRGRISGSSRHEIFISGRDPSDPCVDSCNHRQSNRILSGFFTFKRFFGDLAGFFTNFTIIFEGFFTDFRIIFQDFSKNFSQISGSSSEILRRIFH